MSPGFVVFDAEAPAGEEKTHIGVFGQLVVGDPVRVEAPFVLALPRGLGLRSLLPEFVVHGIGLAPVSGLVVVVRYLDGPDHLRLLWRTAQDNNGRDTDDDECQCYELYVFHNKPPWGHIVCRAPLRVCMTLRWHS